MSGNYTRINAISDSAIHRSVDLNQECISDKATFKCSCIQLFLLHRPIHLSKKYVPVLSREYKVPSSKKTLSRRCQFVEITCDLILHNTFHPSVSGTSLQLSPVCALQQLSHPMNTQLYPSEGSRNMEFRRN